MSRTSKIAWLLSLLLLCVSQVHAGEQRGLMMEVFYHKGRWSALLGPNARGNSATVWTFYVVLRNTEDTPLIVARSMFEGEPTYSWTPGNPKAKVSVQLFAGTGIMASRGGENIPSASELSLVTLTKGEATEIIVQMREDFADVDENNIGFRYRVTDAIAKRYNTWAGTIEVVAKPLSAASKNSARD